MAMLFTQEQFEELKNTISRAEKELDRIIKTKGGLPGAGASDSYHGVINIYIEEIQIRTRLSELKRLTAKAKIIEPKQDVEKVGIGNEVMIEYENGKKEKIVLEGYLIRPEKNLASIYSPLGKAIKGAKVGQEKIIRLEDKKKRIKILEIIPHNKL